jgi:hypothetical protein
VIAILLATTEKAPLKPVAVSTALCTARGRAAWKLKVVTEDRKVTVRVVVA